MAKKRLENVIASSISSYFGLGFNDPQDQLEIDLGNMEVEFDDDAQDRMDLGSSLENGCLDYFEKKLSIVIDERNSENKYAVDGLLKCKRDGRTFLNGIETGVENKVSNSNSKNFVDNIDYHIQCQCYMMAWELDQWMLCGIWKGKPQFRIIKADKEMQKDIKEMVETVMGILSGILDKDDFPWHLVEKYSTAKELKVLDDEELEEGDLELLDNLGELKTQKSIIEKQIKELDEYFKNRCKNT